MASTHLVNFAWDKVECIRTKYSVGSSLREITHGKLRTLTSCTSTNAFKRGHLPIPLDYLSLLLTNQTCSHAIREYNTYHVKTKRKKCIV